MAITFLTNEDKTELEQKIEEMGSGSGGNADLTNVVKSETIATIWTGTQEEYDAITEKSDTTLYMIKEVN